ncbi:MAG: ABC transporter substrate-binding protein [Acidimicrobiia bacterium]|nr:ABC transporter substrate-binding protein [Acidimicrobiia bacterium]
MRKQRSALFLALALILAACGGTSAETTVETTVASVAATTTTTEQASTTTSTAAVAEPEAVTFVGADGVESTIEDTSRIVSLGGDLTEIIFELGLGDNVVGIDVTTTYPAEATDIAVVGFGQQISPEPILALEPTLVLADTQAGPPEVLQQIRDAGVPVVVLEYQSTLDGVGTKIGQVAEILGVPEAGQALADRVNGEITEAQTLAAQADTQPNVAFIYVRGPELVLLFGAGMPTSAMIEGANAIDVAAASGVFGAAPVTPEALVAAAPDVIVVPESGFAALGGADAFVAIPGIAETPAGQTGALLVYDEAYFFNFGPRVGQALLQFVKDLHPELAGG